MECCLDWLNLHPDKLSGAFADQFRQHRALPETFAQQTGGTRTALQLVDDVLLGRQLAVEKAAARLADALRPELMSLGKRMHTLHQQLGRDAWHADVYGPLAVMRALSHAVDTLELPAEGGSLLVQSAIQPVGDTLRHTYSALTQYLSEQGVAEHAAASPALPSPSRQAVPTVGQEILAHLQAVAALGEAPSRPPAATTVPAQDAGTPAARPHFLDSLADWQNRIQHDTDPAHPPSARVLRQLQRDARNTDAGCFDLAVLDAVASLFEFILDDPDMSPRYKSAIAQLQIPTLRAALIASDFFSDDQHPARRLIDLLGRFSRQFPENHPAHAAALEQVETACTAIVHDGQHQVDGFAIAHATLSAWLHAENARNEAEQAVAVARLEQIERQELGTLLALENLHDLSARHPAPQAVLRRLEAAWVPYMASLYVAEAGEGPDWRAACTTLLHLFLSLQPPTAETREIRLQSIPGINAELRRGLLAQCADAGQLKDFFSAITATQASWIRPDPGADTAAGDAAAFRHDMPDKPGSPIHPVAPPPAHDPVLLQAQQLLEGDWVDFSPPLEGLTSARVAWVGVRGYLLFCDSTGEQRFSLDCERLASEIRTGRACIPEQSLTRKAMLRLKTQLLDKPE